MSGHGPLLMKQGPWIDTGAIITRRNVRIVMPVDLRFAATVVTHAMSPYTVLATDSVLLCDAVAGPIAIVLPAVASSDNRELEVLDWTDHAAANNIAIQAQPGETVNGLASVSIVTDGGGCKLRSTTTVWRTKRSTV
jgi:hypothetical protein